MASNDPEMKDNVHRLNDLSLESGPGNLPSELPIQIAGNLDLPDLENFRLSSGKMSANSDMVMPRLMLDQCHHAAIAIYDYLLPDGKKLPEIPYRGYFQPHTAATVLTAASLLKAIPEKEEDLVTRVLAIDNEDVKAQSLATMSFWHSNFKKSNLEKIITEALRISAGTSVSSDIYRAPANLAIRRLEHYQTSGQKDTIETRTRSDPDFSKAMRSYDQLRMEKNYRYWPGREGLKISEVNHDSIDGLASGDDFQPRRREIDLLLTGLRISKAAESLTEQITSLSNAAAQEKSAAPSSSRDFSNRKTREQGGRAD